MNNKDFAAEYSTLVTFVRAKADQDGERGNVGKQKDNHGQKNTISGDEAKKFYEETLKVENTSTPSSKSDPCVKKGRAKRKEKPIRDKIATGVHSVHELLKVAQNGEVAKVKTMILNGVDVNVSDGFGWNALMCAAHNGHFSTVKLLLENDVDKTRCDTKGRNAVKLAKVKGHREVADYIEKFSYRNTDSYSDRTESSSETETVQTFFCPVCKSEFRDTSKKAHDTSTVHLFNLKLKPKEDPFVIPSSNVGYRLMVKSGWDGQKGLGAESQGKRHPVKTVLKRDRACLGSEEHASKKAKVTHFGANDHTAVKKSDKHLDRKMTAKTLSKKAQKFRDKKAKDWERNLRHHMNFD